MHDILQPEGWAKPIGYSNGVAARGRQIYIGGQIGWNGQCEFETDDFVEQVRQTRSEEHTSELQSLMRISYAVFCLEKKTAATVSSCCVDRTNTPMNHNK